MPERHDEIAIKPAGRTPVHASITEEQISDLVDGFYARVWADDRLGPIFSARLESKRDEHLAKMKMFWSSVLLRTGAYKGRPVPAHVQLTEVCTDDFQIWLGLFRPVARDVFSPAAAPLVIEAAERIATSLWLAMFGTPFSNPPDWRAAATSSSNINR